MKTPSKGYLPGMLALAALLSVGPAALAQSHKDANLAGENWQPVRHLTFTDDDIEGGRLEPVGERIDSVSRAAHSSLIEIRQGFEAEIVKSMEDM